MNKTLCLVALAFTIAVAGCNTQRFQKAEDGSEYKVISNEKGTKAVSGNFVELNILVKYKDSVLFSTADNGMPNFIPFDTMSFPKFFRNVHEGDSLVIKQSTDSIIALGQNPPWMQKGNFILQTIKIAKVYPTEEAAMTVQKTYEEPARVKRYQKTIEEIEKDLGKNADQLKKDESIIKDYLTNKNIQAEKTKWGTYVAITSEGTGPKLTDKDVAVVTYTGKNFQDSTFDSNAGKEPLYVDMSEFRVIPGWIDGLQMFQKGSKGKIVIPSTLAYGADGRLPKIQPNENLMFDIEVTDIISREAYHKQMEEQQKMMQMMQQQMQEQMQQQQPAK